MSLAFVDIFMFFGVSCVNLSPEMLHMLLFPLPFFLGGGCPVFLIGSKNCDVVFRSIFDGVSVKMAVVLFFLFTFCFWIRLQEEVECPLGKNDVFLSLKYMLMVMKNQSTSLGVHRYSERCCSHRMGRSTSNVSPYSFFVMKNIPVEGVNSENLETCFYVPRRSREMLRRVDNTRNVIYFHVWPGYLVTQVSHTHGSRTS